MLSIGDADRILRLYHLLGNAQSVTPLQETVMGEERRLIYRVDTSDGGQWVCRLTREAAFPRRLIEQQSQFAMMLYDNGVLTPWKAQSDGRFCVEIYIKGFAYHVTVESYLEGDQTPPSPAPVTEFGKLIGKTHALSKKFHADIDFSVIGNAISSGKARLSTVISSANTPIPDMPSVRYAAASHDNLISQLSAVWKDLPKGGVHGDLGVFNNIIYTKNGMGIIDFNLSGEEAYLADALSAYYSSSHKREWSEFGENELHDFISGYVSEYRFCASERRAFSNLAALFDGLYFCKKIIQRWNISPNADVLTSFRDAERYFDPNRHSVSLCIF